MTTTKTTVVNIKYEPYDVYIGRAGRDEEGNDLSGYFGNPIRIGRVCQVCGEIHDDRGSTITCFRQLFVTRLVRDSTFRQRVLALRGQRLGCFCKSRPPARAGQCHGDVYAAYADGRLRVWLTRRPVFVAVIPRPTFTAMAPLTTAAPHYISAAQLGSLRVVR